MQLPLEFKHCFRVPLNASSSECKSKELTFAGFNDVAFGRIDDQFEAVLQELTYAVEHSLASPPTFHQDCEVISISGKLVTAAFQLEGRG